MRPPSPKDFLYAPVAPRRIGGNEAEYDTQMPNAHLGEIDAHLLTEKRLERAGFVTVRDQRGALWLTNGGNLHMDVKRIEYSSGETATAADAAASNLSSIPLMQRLAATREGTRVFRHSGTMIDGEFRTLGYHRSFMVPYSAFTQWLAPVWDTYQATAVWAGGGMVGEQGFEFFQKAPGVGAPTSPAHVNRTHEGKKPMGWIKVDDPDVFNPSGTDQPLWLRLESRTVDGGFSRWEAFMSEAIGSLVLRLVEHQRILGKAKPLQRIALRDPVAAYKTVSADLGFKQTYLSCAGRRLGALDYQKLIADYGNYVRQRIELPEAEHSAVDMLFDIIERLEHSNIAAGDVGLLKPYVNFAPRLAYIGKFFEPPLMHSGNRDAVERSLQWSRIQPAGPGLRYWQLMYEKGKAPDPTGDNLIEHHLIHPAADTRAAMRVNGLFEPPFNKSVNDVSWRWLRIGQQIIWLYPYETDLQRAVDRVRR